MLEIINRHNNKVIHSGEFDSIKELSEDGDRKGISFEGADLRYADLENANLREADLRYADLENANLREADLRGADLRGADLRGVDLRGVNLRNADLRDVRISFLTGNNREIKTLQLGTYTVNFTKDTLAIGCQQHPIEDWKSFSDEQISDMDYDVLEWLDTWKEIIFTIINKG